MTEFVRLAKDPAAPAALRAALDRAASEKAAPETHARVLAAAAGAGLASIASPVARLPPHVPAPLGGSTVAAKAIAALALFAAGAVSGGYAVHRHDLRSGVLAAARGGLAPVAMASSSAPAPPPRDALRPVEAAASEPAVAASGPSSAYASPARLPRREGSAIRERIGGDGLRKADPVAAGALSLTAPSSREALASLRAIRDAVEGDRIAEALAAIEAHRARFSGSAFAAELLFLEARAHVARRDPSACEVLARFSTLYPRSLLARRARPLGGAGGCDGGDASPPEP